MRRFGEYGMKEYLAHSATDKYPSQTYKSHITGVMEKAIQYTTEMEFVKGLFCKTQCF